MSSGTPYIGSKISLISKAKIRYEGFLYTIDAKDSTVTLAKVISIGTEDRCPENPVPPREEVFEYIVFRGTDIDDLHVCEAPKPQDPAIVHNGPIQTHHAAQNYQTHHPHQGYGPFVGGITPYGYSPFFQQKTQKPPSLPQTPTPEPTKNLMKDSDRGHHHDDSREDNCDNYDRRHDDRDHRENRKGNKDRSHRESRHSRDSHGNHGHKEYKHKDSDHYRDSNRKPRRDDLERDKRDTRKEKYTDRHEERRLNHDQNIRSNRSRSSKDNSNHRDNNQNNRSSNLPKFTEDFDFETANAKFHKEEIQRELLLVLNKVKLKDDDVIVEKSNDVEDEKDTDELEPLPTPEKYYDRSKSFFDNISCEAMAPKSEDKEVMTRRQEKSLNTETFGSSAANYRSYRGRGRGRNRGRGRGYHRGRGSYRGSTNRSWVNYEFDYEAAGIRNPNRQVHSSTGGS